MTKKSQQPPEVVRWLPRKRSPWSIPLLDVSPFTQHSISTTGDETQADNVFALQGEDGRRFAGAPPWIDRTTTADLAFPSDGRLYPGILFAPAAMEHKWAIFFHGQDMIFLRSWTHEVRVVAHVEQEDARVVVVSIHGVFFDETETSELTVRMLDYLLQSHVLRDVFPVPLPPDAAVDVQQAAQWCFHLFGNLAHVAATEAVPDRTPRLPLRTRTLLHIAAARGDENEVRRQLATGLPTDLLAPGEITPLHWAAAAGNLAVVRLLLEHGADPSLEAEGETPCSLAEREGHAEIVALLDAARA